MRELLPLLAGRGHDISLLCERAAPPGRETIDGRVARLPCWCVETAGLEAALRSAAHWRADVAYVHGLESPVAEAAILAAFPTVLFAHNYHGTCVSGTKRHALPSARPCGRSLGPGCLIRYYPCRCGGLSPVTLLRQYGVQRRRRAMLPRYRMVTVASRHMAEEYRRHGVPDDRLRLLPLFAPDSQPDPKRPRRGPAPAVS